MKNKNSIFDHHNLGVMFFGEGQGDVDEKVIQITSGSGKGSVLSNSVFYILSDFFSRKGWKW